MDVKEVDYAAEVVWEVWFWYFHSTVKVGHFESSVTAVNPN